MIAYIGIAVALMTFVYWYLTRNFDYWTKRGIRGPKPVILLGNIHNVLFDSGPKFELEWYQKFGKIYGYFMTTAPILTVAEPELVKQVLVKDFQSFPNRRHTKWSHPIIKKCMFFARNDTWKRVRSISTPTFTSGKIKNIYSLVRDCLSDLLNYLETCAESGSDIDLKHAFGNYTMDVIARCAFATKTNAHLDSSNAFVLNARNIFNFNVMKIFLIVVLPKSWLKYFNILSFADENSNQFFFSLTRNIIQMRRNDKSSKYVDFLQLLMDAELEEMLEASGTKNVAQNKRLTEEEILGQAWIFFIAGYETTATTLTYFIYELALNPVIQEKLFNEIDAAFDANGEIDYETLLKLPYLEACLSETLRAYPPLMRLERECAKDCTLADTGLTIERGTLVEVPIYAIHHSSEFYPDPERFDPERFSPENIGKIIPYTYIPFGSGPRNCIGMRFALMEAKLCLAHVVRNYRFARTHKTDVPLVFKRMSRLIQTNPVYVSISKR